MSTHLSTAPHQPRKKRELTRAVEPLKFRNGAPGGIRTPDQVVRSHLLYPAELRVRNSRAPV